MVAGQLRDESPVDVDVAVGLLPDCMAVAAALLPIVMVIGAPLDGENEEYEIAAALPPTVTVTGVLLEGRYRISV